MILDVEVDILGRVVRTLAKGAAPEDILNLYSTPEENERIEELTQKNRDGVLTINECFEINQYMLAEQYVRLAKAHAYARLNGLQIDGDE